MANSTIDVLARLPWLVSFNLSAFVALERTVHNTDDQLDPLLNSLLDALNTWKNQSNKSVMSFQSLLQNFYQGVLLGASIPECNTLFNGGGFFNFLATLPLDYGFPLEIIEDPTGQQPPQITSSIITTWTTIISTAQEYEDADVENIGESIHQASTNYVYNTMFRPSSITPLSGSPHSTLLDVKGYRKLTFLNSGLIIEV